MSFGTTLHSQERLVESIIKENVEFTHDLKDFLKERASLEKEYASKLEQLSRGAIKKFLKDKKDDSGFSVGSSGDNDSGNGTTTAQKAWYSLLTSTEAIAQTRQSFANNVLEQVYESTKTLMQRKEESRKKHVQYSAKMNEAITLLFEDVEKAKRRYHESCISVDVAKSKHEAAEDIKAKEKEKRKWNAEILDMHNRKNEYLLKLDVANEVRRWWEEEEKVSMLDQMQDLNDTFVESLTTIFTKFAALDHQAYAKQIEQLKVAEDQIALINVQKDDDLLIAKHSKPTAVLERVRYVPTELWDDKQELINTEHTLAILRGKVSKTSAKLDTLMNEINTKLKSLDGLRSLYDAYKTDPAMGDADEIKESILAHHRELSALRVQRIEATEIISKILSSIGTNAEAKPHDFKGTSFAIPTTCNYCKTNIWGVGKGVVCRECGYNAHVKCQLKAPQDCASSKLPEQLKFMRDTSTQQLAEPSGITNDKTGTQQRSQEIATNKPSAAVRRPANNEDHDSAIETPSSATDSRQASSPSKTASPISATATRPPVDTLRPIQIIYLARLLYSTSPKDDEELRAHEGDIVEVVEEDDGSGWTGATIRGSKKGIVPTSYLQKVTADILYDYTADGPEELSVREGQKVDVVKLDEDGWTTIRRDGRSGIVPSSYLTVHQ